MISRYFSNTIAVSLLLAMFVFMFFSSVNESAIMDELAHIPAGYSYLTQKDYRLNPEHPPLIKDLSAIPLLFLDLNFPTNIRAWSEDVNGQWDMGRAFLYESGNNPDKIIFWSRLPMMILTLLLGWLIFSTARRLYGDGVGLLALSFYSFSPTFIAHSRYVTTDLAAAFGFFIAITAFIYQLKSPDPKRLIVAGLAFGTALLLKFSLALLAPLFVLFIFLWGFLSQLDNLQELDTNFNRAKKLFYEWCRLGLNFLIISIIAVLLIATVYQYHVWNYPLERQTGDTEFLLSSFGFRPAADFVSFMASKPPLRGLGQYALGLLMVIQRAAGGNTTYFLGQVSNSGWWYYFPLAYLLKEPLAFLLFLALSVFIAVKSVLDIHEKSWLAVFEWMRDNFFLTAGSIFIAVYWLQSIKSPLNIGVRHVLPTFPFVYILVSREIMRWLRFYSLNEPRSLGEWFFSIYEKFIKSVPRYFLVSFFMLWLGLETVFAFPNYLSYYNVLAGGSGNGYKYIVDSNYDWGQDLKRLRDFAETNKIEKIAVDYFGGGSPQYYLGSRFVPWQSSLGRPSPDSKDPKWFAISATIRQGALAKPAQGFTKNSEDSYLWLEGLTPYARAGHSIFIYKF
ncbi:MAG: hypothetical protein A2931_03905 [Candidatus Niyogibacteria bacterium RIFCSPLOWO2_01_FULL_45_48]|uniref:Glycosyltransferase RgtA/B/C/D-like domain-containing protein n=2 Tax=Candidatus Niyogiibacteriota TaxID=1817912 RepID=A0A1G2EXX7_9BACT|nr:MAG: hypothetical protein A3J00_00605 [Candidatus Niyogibacteria bacterium RIFCSPLOWO2_02_FULL_45_13]OGZ31517.1 MAG: hypothetical protein A2931_03905 [Candidatus Niyogibacteria bacterium RIFCSPLOWO2_01_FULL_45_48]